jgi:RNA polymerase sigma factor (sigma-70 family)
MKIAANEPDAQLIERFLVGSVREADVAFAALVMRHRPAVMSLCHRVLGRHADAEDATQETFVALFRNAGRIRHRHCVGAWLYGVAYRIAIRMWVRSARRQAVHDRFGIRAEPERAEDAVALLELRKIVHEEVNHLPEGYRTLVVHSYLEGQSCAELARSLRCPIGTVKGRLWRARGMLRERLLARLGPSVESVA